MLHLLLTVTLAVSSTIGASSIHGASSAIDAPIDSVHVASEPRIVVDKDALVEPKPLDQKPVEPIDYWARRRDAADSLLLPHAYKNMYWIVREANELLRPTRVQPDWTWDEETDRVT